MNGVVKTVDVRWVVFGVANGVRSSSLGVVFGVPLVDDPIYRQTTIGLRGA